MGADDKEVTFSQEQLNGHIKSAKEEATAKVFSDLGFKDATEVADFRAANAKSEEVISTLKAEVEGYKLKDLKIGKATEHGIGIDNLDFLTGNTAEEIESQAKKLSELIKSNSPELDKKNPEAKPKTNVDFGDALSGLLKEDK